ncbi:MAG: 1,4-dihydroxy-2-naphthoate octaprenyltransferase [Planctomycetota bacterium]|jgi:1,4-dihydroxy-2-naphthoate octaprenyltransferase
MTTSTVNHPSKVKIWLMQARAPFVTAGIIPVLVGSAAGFGAAGSFNLLLFALALVAIICLHFGANLANEYFDHLSGNDRLNKNRNRFSGGSGLMLQGLTSPRAVLIAAWLAFALATAIGFIMLLITKSLFILALGLVGIFGGYFYTANPFKLGYRGAGEIIIAFLFGMLPVYGACFLQAGTIDLVPFAPAVIVSLLAFLIILINEFPDRHADAAVNKRTLVVLLGPASAATIYRAALILSYVVAFTAAVIQPQMRWAGLLYLLTIPFAVAILKFLKTETLTGPDKYRANMFTVLLHLTGGFLLSLGLLF